MNARNLWRGHTDRRIHAHSAQEFFGERERELRATNLNWSSKSNYLIRIDRNIRLFTSHLADKVLNSWYSCRSTNKNYFVYIFEGKVGIPQGSFNWCFKPVKINSKWSCRVRRLRLKFKKQARVCELTTILDYRKQNIKLWTIAHLKNKSNHIGIPILNDR